MKSQNDGSLGRESRKEIRVSKNKGSIAFKIRAVLRQIKNAKAYGVNFFKYWQTATSARLNFSFKFYLIH